MVIAREMNFILPLSLVWYVSKNKRFHGFRDQEVSVAKLQTRKLNKQEFPFPTNWRWQKSFHSRIDTNSARVYFDVAKLLFNKPTETSLFEYKNLASPRFKYEVFTAGNAIFPEGIISISNWKNKYLKCAARVSTKRTKLYNFSS